MKIYNPEFPVRYTEFNMALTILVRALDLALTGQVRTDSTGARIIKPDELCFDEFYCADGGYSRFQWSEESGHLFLHSNSTQEVKNHWQADAAAVALRHRIDALMASWYKWLSEVKVSCGNQFPRTNTAWSSSSIRSREPTTASHVTSMVW